VDLNQPDLRDPDSDLVALQADAPAARGALELQADVAAALEQRRQRRYLALALLRSPTFVIGVLIVLFWVVMGVFSTAFTQSPALPHPFAILQSPSGSHWFGTDDLGRDVFARTMAGARTVLIIAPLATILALLWGGMVGLTAGFYRGLTDDVMMRVVDAFLALPIIITAILIISLLGRSYAILILVIGALFTPVISRTIRSAVIGEREREYVMAARLRGERSAFVMAREILPNITQPIIVEGTVRLGYAVFTVATLSFLGFGLEPPSPDWGLTVAYERQNLQAAPWVVLFPAIALATLVVGVNLIADGLSSVFSK
jgi:peptide/nickel transport system permease protein